MVGTSDSGGANSLTSVKDGVTLSTNAQPTWVCILNVPMVPPQWTR